MVEEVDLSEFNLKTVMYASELFENCEQLVKINFGKQIFENLILFDYAFHCCSGLEHISLDFLRSPYLTRLDNLFRECTSLLSVDLSNMISTKVNDITNLFLNCSLLRDIKFPKKFCPNLETADGAFMGTNLRTLDLRCISFEYTTNMNSLCAECMSLEEVIIDFSKANSVYYMNNAFFMCTDLWSVELINFNPKNLEFAQCFFESCKSLSNIDLHEFTGEAIKNMDNFCNNCVNLEDINLSSFSPNHIETIKHMFDNCLSLHEIKFKLPSNILIDMSSTFANCINLNSLEILCDGEITPSSVTGCFYKCESLESLDLSNFYFYKGVKMTDTFFDCPYRENFKLNTRFFAVKKLLKHECEEHDFYSVFDIVDSTTEDWTHEDLLEASKYFYIQGFYP